MIYFAPLELDTEKNLNLLELCLYNMRWEHQIYITNYTSIWTETT
jgi:hypothetical protein